MDARKMVEDDIQANVRKAMKLGILSNPRMSGEFFKNRQAITSKYTRFADEHDYLENYYKKYEQSEFLAAFQDGGFLQINYEFDLPNKKIHTFRK